MQTLVCLISKQLEANLYAVLQFKPERVVFVHTIESRNEADLFADYLEQRLGLNVFADDFSQVEAFDMILIKQQVQTVLTTLAQTDSTITVNYTAGTKPMGIQFYTEGLNRDFSLVYTDTQNNVFYWEEAGFQQRIPFNFELKPFDYLWLRDAKIIDYQSFTVDSNLKELTHYIFTNRSNKESLLYIKLLKPMVQAKVYSLPISLHLYSDAQLKVINEDEKGICVFWNNTELRQPIHTNWLDYFSGGWFEYWVASTLAETGTFKDIILNTRIAPSEPFYKKFKHESVKNEIDVLALSKQIPFLFECKSGEVKQQHITNLYAISSYYFPKYNHSFLISYFPIAPELIEKCTNYGIHVVAGRNHLVYTLKTIADQKMEKL